jgi:hypothetical protein
MNGSTKNCTILLCAGLTIGLAGCNSTPKPTDASLTAAVQNAISTDTSLAGQPIQVSVQSAVATVSGTVDNDAERTLAARDAAGVAGVSKVVNSISVGAVPTSASVRTPPPPALQPAPAVKQREVMKPQPQFHQPAPIERPQQQAYNNPPPPPQPQAMPEPMPQTAPVAPPPPPQPVFKVLTIASGDTIPVRVTQTLDSASTQPDTTFTGVVASDIIVNGLVAIPAGSSVSGHVDAVQDAGHFKGSSLLTVSLTAITRRGERIAVTTDPYSVKGKGRGANTAEKTGGGAAVGAILGGIFGGGKGAAIGAAAGGGVGAGSNAITRGQQVQIESESVVRFHLSAPIVVKVRTDGGEHLDDNGLQQHPPQ